MPVSVSDKSAAVSFAGVTFRGVSLDAIRLASDQPKFVVPVNADLIVRAHEDDEFKAILNQHLATIDGQIPYVLARLRRARQAAHLDKLSGSDLIYVYLREAAQAGKAAFLFGASPASNARGVEAARKMFGGVVEGYSPPLVEEPLPPSWTEEALTRIRAVRPAYLFVALGAPKQERWIANNLGTLRDIGVEFVMGCGGSVDFLGGTIKRAPKWVQLAGMEGVYRLILEPKLFRLQRILRSFRIFLYAFR